MSAEVARDWGIVDHIYERRDINAPLALPAGGMPGLLSPSAPDRVGRET